MPTTTQDTDFVPLQEAQRSFEVQELKEQVDRWAANYELMQENIAELELSLDDEGWRRLGLEGEREFSRTGLDKIISLARIMYLKNPLIQRGVEIRAFYVWGQGVEVQAVHTNEDVNSIVQSFMDNLGNRREFTAHAARVMKEKKLQSEGNIFFVLFTNKISGMVRLRSIPVSEIRDIHMSPDDRNEIWFYQREWNEEKFDLASGKKEYKVRKALYPDWSYKPAQKPSTMGEFEVKWDSPVYHVRVGGFDDMRFGVPETYAAIDWARAYKGFLEDWASLAKAVSRYAWKVTSKKKNQIAKVKTRLQSTASTEERETNPPPLSGSTFIGTDNIDLAPINKTGMTTSASDGKMLRLMVASALHLPDTILSNDPQQGALATAKTLDRPTEMAMTDRQKMWQDIFKDILLYVLIQKAQASNSDLPFAGKVETDEDENDKLLVDGEAVTIEVTFPPIIEYDLKERIDAIISAMTLDGKSDAGIAPKDLFRRLLLSTLGVKDIDDVLEDMEDIEEEPEEEEPLISPESMKEFVKELKQIREAIAA